MVVTGFCAPRSRGSLRALILRAAFVVGVAAATSIGIHATASAAQSDASERVEQARESYESPATAASNRPAPDEQPTSPPSSEDDTSASPTEQEPPEAADLVEQAIDEHADQQPEPAEPDDSPAPDEQPSSDEPDSSAPIVEAERTHQAVPTEGADTVVRERTARPDVVSTAGDTEVTPPAPAHGPTDRVTSNDEVQPPPPADGDTEPTYPLPGQPNAPPTHLTAQSTASGLGNGGKGLFAVLPATLFVPTAGPPAQPGHADANRLIGSVTTGPSASPD